MKDKTGIISIVISGTGQLNNITNISKLKNSGLKKITIKGIESRIQQISDITPLSEITSLEEVTFDWSNISNLPDFSKLVNLKKLTITNSFLKGIEGIKNCSKITDINVSNNSVSSIHGIENLRNLASLTISNNSLFDTFSYTDEGSGTITKNTVDILADLYSHGALRTLNISNNTGITSYGELPNLSWTAFTK